MKSTFSRIFTTIAVLLLVALIMIGIAFQLLVKDYLVDSTVQELKNDGRVIAQLVQSVYEEGFVTGRDFNLALGVASSVSGHDAVICDASGKLLLCAVAFAMQLI